jgi:uncharacterized membrane protein YkoI
VRHALTAFALLTLAAATASAQKPTYARDVPPALAKRTRVKESDAAAVARKLVPGAAISALELEREGGKLIYSFDMKTPGKDGIDEVNIDAVTGKQVGKVGHESGADEANEAAAEKKSAPKKGGGGR